jgi:RNA polymerase sigma factor (sigma-70 family)
LNSRLSPWLFTVCRNRALDVVRKESRMKLVSQEEIELQASPELSPAAQAEQRETTNEALELIARLPRNQQEVVRLKFQNGLSYQEISEVTRLSVSNVGFLLHTALRTLRQQLQRETLRKNP